MPRQVVRIENPAPGGQSVTSLERARRFIRKGRAEFTAPLVIRFLEKPVHRIVSRDAFEKVLAQNAGYDRTDRSFVGDQQDGRLRIPIISADKMIREEKSSRDWSYSAAVRHSVRRAHTPQEVALIRAGV